MKRGVLVGIVFLFIVYNINAAGLGVCLNAHVTDISPTSIKIGEEFTVGIEIDNCGYDSPNYVTFELKDISPYIQVTDPLKKDIGKIGYASSNRFMLYHMRVTDDAIPGKYIIPYELVYGPNWNKTVKEDGKIEIRLVGESANLNIASLKTNPILPKEDDTIELILRIENYGDGEANSVKVRLSHDFKGIKEAYLGTLQPNEDSPAVFTFISQKKGEYNIPVTITYVDDFGRKDVVTDINLTILKKETNIGMIILLGLILIGVIIGSYYLIKKYNKKDELIKDLLGRGEIKKRKRSSKKRKR